MNNVVRLALVDPFDSSRNSVKNLLLGIDTVWLEAECSRYDFFSDIVQQTQPDIALINLDSDSQKGLALLQQITSDLPACAVFVLSSSQEGSLILQAMRMGAKEFLNSPLKLDDFMAALDRLRSSGGKKDKTRGSRVISVCGASGGIGCTSLAINLGCILAQNKANSVAIIDLDLALGDSDVWLDIIPDYTIQDVAENITRLDYSLLKRSLSQHASGAFLLPRPIHMEEHSPINAEQLQRVIALLKATFSHLIIDLSKAFSPLDLGAMQVSDVTLLVTQLDLPCLRNVVRLLQFLDERELSQNLKVVVNRVGLGDSQISLSKALETIGREVYWQLPNEYATMIESRNNGVPLIMQAPRSKLTKSIEALAAQLDSTTSGGAPEAAEGGDKPKRRLFSFLGSK
ncbi:MAG TPA: response regulator [Caulifigura sp.]|jgi:pilus assembly protein CpaE|nr:response regulator [Caulifigura sp.]